MEENGKQKQKEINDLCFFRPLLPGFSERMPLPQGLDEHLNMDESRKTATLVSHIDKTCVWHVDFHREEKEMFIEGEGWKIFVQAHDLRDFYMLVFRYRGNMVFTFRVFDKMTYCKNSFVSQKDAKEKEILIDHHEDENTNIIKKPTKSSCTKRKAKDLTHLLPISLKRVTRSSKDQVAGEIEKNFARKVSFEATVKPSNLNERRFGMGAKEKEILIDHNENENMNIIQKPTKSSCRKRKAKDLTHLCPISLKRVTRSSKDQVAGERDKNFARKVSFEATVKPSKLNARRFGMKIPSEFIKSCGLPLEHGELVLCDPEGRNWLVGLFKCEGSHAIFISKGWSKFARGNRLKEGDRCIFELAASAQGNNKLLNVKILKCTRTQQADKTDEMENLSLKKLSARAALLPTKCPVDHNTLTKFAEGLQFEATISASNLTSYYLYIPREFEERSGLDKLSEVVLKDPRGQRWPVALYHRRKNRTTHMLKGWIKFATGNNLKEGHRCIFKLLTEGKGNVLQVQILRTKQVQILRRRWKKTGRLLHFEATISDCSRKRSDFYIRRFEDWHVFEGLRKVILVDPAGRHWPVGVVHRIRQVGDGDIYMTKGWKEFARGNHLQNGDKCIFDGLQGYVDVLQVQILKKRKEHK